MNGFADYFILGILVAAIGKAVTFLAGHLVDENLKYLTNSIEMI